MARADDESVDERLTGNILEELRAQNALRSLGLSDDDLSGIAEAVAINVDYAFRVEWEPRWEADAP
jgi:hypothetical protein